MELIALSGFARSGKDEAAKVLVERFGFKQIAFADKLREALYALNPMVVADGEHHGILPVGYNGPVHRFLADVIDEYGWEGYKSSPFSQDMRRLIQRLGTNAGREVLGDTIWIDAALTGLDENAKVVASDGRFFNELDAVREYGGYVWRIERESVGPANDHPSELEAVDYPYFSLRLENNGTLEQWHDVVAREYESGRYKEWSW